jgi:hypothetical protein
MLQFKKGKLPELNFLRAVKKPIPVRCIQINEPFEVETMEGVLEGKAGDYLMIGIKGEMYPCAQEVFKETYDIIS